MLRRLKSGANGFALGVAATLYWTRDYFDQSITTIQHRLNNEPLKYGVPEVNKLERHPHYASLINYWSKSPSWVIEHLTPSVLEATVERQGFNFHECSDIPAQFRAQNEDYFRSGFSRGHLCPAGNSKASSEAMKASFRLNSNIVPQEYQNNAYYWNRIEKWVKALVETQGFTSVHVVSGPLYLDPKNSLAIKTSQEDKSMEAQAVDEKYPKSPSHVREIKFIGKRQVAVPSHLFKAVIAERPGKSEKDQPDTTQERYFAAFVVPNMPIPDEIPLTDFQVSLATLQSWSGIDLFPAIKPAANAEQSQEVEAAIDTATRIHTRVLDSQDQVRDPFPNLCKHADCILMDAKKHRVMQLMRSVTTSRRLVWLKKDIERIRDCCSDLVTDEMEAFFKIRLQELETAES